MRVIGSMLCGNEEFDAGRSDKGFNFSLLFECYVILISNGTPKLLKDRQIPRSAIPTVPWTFGGERL